MIFDQENMSQLTRCTTFLLVIHSAVATTIDLVSAPGNEEIGTCLGHRETLHSIRASVHTIIPSLAVSHF